MGLCGDAPKTPDYEAAAIAGVYADVNTLPTRRKIEAAARLGEKVEIDGKTYDFTGLGDAQVTLETTRRLSQTMLDIQEEFGSAYVAQRLAELEQSDPEGRQARRDLFSGIIDELEDNRDRPLAESTQARVMSELLDSSSLRPQVEREVRQQVRGGQVARGNYLGAGNTYTEAKAVTDATDYNRSAKQQQALSFLQSGATPEDVDYRKNQQDMANLGAFLNGERPVAQFGQLSGGQNGASPFLGGQGLSSGLNPNAAQQGANWNQNIYSQQYNWNQNQVNPYVAGIGTAFQAAGTAGSLGWQPFGAGGANAANAAINPSNAWQPG